MTPSQLRCWKQRSGSGVCVQWGAGLWLQLADPSLAFLYFLLEAGGRRVVSHEVVLGGKLAAKTSFSLSRPSSPRVEELKGE